MPDRMQTMRTTRRIWFTVIAAMLVLSCRDSPAPAQPPKPQTVTLIVEGMT
jgi:hypothetical protein